MSLRLENQAEPIPGYRLLERLGGGGFGEVWKAVAPGGLHKAIKIIHGDLRTAEPDGARHAEQELKALKRVQAIRHPYLLSLERYDVIEGRLLIVMELADCNLWDRFRECRSQGLAGIPRTELLRYLEESSEVLDLMNNKYALQHLDIKPQNLFLIHNHVKVADFGLVKDLEGVRAAITGGVTPVYAAPETFDGIATRFCDQYSLAIVYQELLTGIRPFNGTNANQLLVQHLQGIPNLSPLPHADRFAVGKALSKKPDDRFPTCLQFIHALQQASGDQIGGVLPDSVNLPASSRAETPAGRQSTAANQGRAIFHTFQPSEPPPETPRTELRFRRDDQLVTSPSGEIVPTVREAPPEQNGAGVLVPAVIIGIGRTGIEIVQKFRRHVIDRFGSFDRMANLRIICLDTDPESLQAAAATGGATEFASSEIIPMRLNRAGHYLKPRRNGRSLIEGWFDPQMLYRIPRNPQTQGIRGFGRLAFCDHYRTFATKLREDLESITSLDALATADKNTQLGLRTNKPRVYVIAGLAGGTGGGMFLDVAYATRHKLKQLGYDSPEVIGLFLVPPATQNVKPQVVANTYAALKELHHYSLPETSYTASHDDRDAQINDSAAPFSRFFVIPSEDAAEQQKQLAISETVTARAAEFLRNDLLTLLGRMADDNRLEFDQQRSLPVTVCAQSQAAFVWPKQAILSHAVRWLGESVVTRWLKTDAENIIQPVQDWLKERWQAEELGPEVIEAQLHKSSEKLVGKSLNEHFSTVTRPLMPRGWFAKDPDQTSLWQTVSGLLQLVGMPEERAIQRQVGKLESHLNEAADAIARELAPKLTRLPRMLLEHPDYRLSGAEEAIKQMQGMLTEMIERYEPQIAESASKAVESYYVVSSFLAEEDEGRRKPSSSELAANLASFPLHRYQNLINRQIARIYMTLREDLTDVAREVQYCRTRLNDLMSRFTRMKVETTPVNDSLLFPVGCTSIEEAVNALRQAIQPDELRILDKAMQKQIEQSYHALFNVCMSSINMLGNLQGVVEEQTRLFLAKRLGDSSLSDMFLSRFRDNDSATAAIRSIYERAIPLVKTRPSNQEICIVAIPNEAGNTSLQPLMRQALTGKMIDFTSSAEEILVYREWPRVPLNQLLQLGSQAKEAYNQMQLAGAGVAHTRNDVNWFNVEFAG